ncbi:hypothetical protein CPB83DRAFT_844051 [Crepidotus variabilis]|uniref:BHLH domain-containing protein n=1 Tax=Crepidotus variabilis TaxID=179855 RepID=A0A9P6ETF0_9AGAR|nr:hypothetical protein CPB83DRAFT_844051 [Crepidotus variabilis]
MSSTRERQHSPVASLASLEYLQNQRRGSITDPSLHAAPHLSSGLKLSPNFRHPHDLPSSSSSSFVQQAEPILGRDLLEPRPASPYVFGNATPHIPEHGSQLRKLLHSPSNEYPSHRPIPSLSHDSHDSNHPRSGISTKEPGFMNVDNDRHSFISRRNIRDPPNFDPNMRRHSIAVGQNAITLPHLSSTLHGTKRKMSDDRSVFPPVGEDDPPLVGPGMHSGMDVDADAPAPKRRGSTIDTQRIAQLSLNDRRNSVDSRGPWLSDRRESAPSLFPSVLPLSSLTSNSDPPPHGRGPSSGLGSLAWSPEPSGISNSSNHGPNSRQLELLNLAPPSNFMPDRRMSVPDILSHATNSRSIRERSRPPSRQNTDPHSGPSSGQDEPSASGLGMKIGKDGSTPYSRSPELRVSHKLAERKRRREMKDLFDELRDQLPADRGMKASKWEILSKAIDFIIQLKRSHQELATEVEILRTPSRGGRSEGLSGYQAGGSVSSHSGFNAPMLPSFPPIPLMQPVSPNQSHSQTTPSASGSPQNHISTSLSSSSQNTNGHRDGPP